MNRDYTQRPSWDDQFRETEDERNGRLRQKRLKKCAETALDYAERNKNSNAGDERAMKIVTNYWPKPIPVRLFDWIATTDNYDGAPDAGKQFVGYGATEEDAIADLQEQLDDAGFWGPNGRFGVGA